MVSHKVIEEQLRKAGCSFQLWGRSEIRELSNILMDNEEIHQCLNGHYEGGFALLCATNWRIILVDRKPMYLTLEDVRYDMIAEIDYSHRLLNATARIFTPTKSLVFTSWNHYRLRKLVMAAQQRVMAIRQYQATGTPQQQPIQQMPQESMQYAPTQPSAYVPMSPLTMPHPATAFQNMAQPNGPLPNIPISQQPSLAVAAPAGMSAQPPVPPMQSIRRPVNPFLSSNLTTRHRSWMKW